MLETKRNLLKTTLKRLMNSTTEGDFLPFLIVEIIKFIIRVEMVKGMNDMAGYTLKHGLLIHGATENDLWAKFNYLFSPSCNKRNTYKFGLLKSIIDNLLNCIVINDEFYLSYENIFEKFTENYWNLILKHNLLQMRPDGKSKYSKIEQILMDYYQSVNNVWIDFLSLNSQEKYKIVDSVKVECRRYVIGALYNDFEGILYGFDLRGNGIYLSSESYDFLTKYKLEIEKINYYCWAQFLESIDNQADTSKILNKLELAVPQRKNLDFYKQILFTEFQQNNCFYCGSKLSNSAHVDHFIPWSYTKEDKLWNFVLACPKCNIKKSNKLAHKKDLLEIEKRNSIVQHRVDHSYFDDYQDKILTKMWNYAIINGFKEM